MHTQTNTIGPLRLCQLFVPVMVKNNYGRIVNMSSGMGTMWVGVCVWLYMCVCVLHASVFACVSRLHGCTGQMSQMNGGTVDYRLSKVSLYATCRHTQLGSLLTSNALTKILNDEMKEKNVIVNSMCPVRILSVSARFEHRSHHAKGFVRTAMTIANGAPLSLLSEPDVPAETAVWLATLPNSGPRGGFFRNKQPIEW